MARAQFWDTAIDNLGNAVTSTRVTVYEKDTTTLATVYSEKTGATLKGNPFDATTGFIDFWMDPGSYDVHISDTSIPPAYSDKTVRWESIPHTDGVYYETLAKGSLGPGYGCFKSVTTDTQTISGGNVAKPAILKFDDSKIDLANAFNTSASTYNFTAPVTGIYHFNVRIEGSNSTSATTTSAIFWMRLNTTSVGSIGEDWIGNLMHSTTFHLNFSAIKEMNAGDIYDVVGWVSGSSPTIFISSDSEFSGHLIARTD